MSSFGMERFREGNARAVSRMTEGIRYVCETFGRRDAGSPGEKAAAEYMAGILRDECGCRDVRTETFSVRPAAFWGYFRFSMTFDCLCAALFFFSPVLSIVSGTAAMALFLFQFVFYWKIIDPLFPQKESVNVTAVRPCSGDVRARIFLNGHIDAAWEFPLNYRFGGIVFEIPGVAAVIGVLYYMTLSVLKLCGAGEGLLTAGLIGLVFVPFFILVGFTYDPNRVVDGANDDLTGCFTGIGILREMERLGVSLEHTEVGVILTGSEEAGLKGAEAWCRAHGEEYGDVPTKILSFDTIHDPKFLMVNFRDLNGTVTSDRGVGEAFLRAAEKEGVPCLAGMVPLMGGATDSAAFTRGGFASVGITGLDHKLEDYYHTRRDTADNLDPRGLENCYLAAVRFLLDADAAVSEKGETET